MAQLAPLEGAARDAGIAELPEAVQPALRSFLGSSNPTIALLRSEGSPEQARFIERAQEGATHAALGKEFGISFGSAWTIRTDLVNAGKIKGVRAAKKQAAPRVKGATSILRTEGSIEQARFIGRAQEGASKAQLGKEFGISPMSANNIRTEFTVAGNLKRTLKQGQGQEGHKKLKVRVKNNTNSVKVSFQIVQR